MITREQIEKHCGVASFSDLLYATLDRDYKARELDYILPAGTIVQIKLWLYTTASLFLNARYIDGCFPYDAATLLETEE